MTTSFIKAKSIKEAFDNFDKLGEYHGVSQNMISASDDGDIAYLLLATHPIRKNKTPYSACHVQDGTTSDNDWEGFVPTKDLYRVINP
jgi:acyl-homoserine lactone acylase PvdQ